MSKPAHAAKSATPQKALMTVEAYRKLLPPYGIQESVFALLKGKRWICRDCAAKLVRSGQYAGGGGIQGLKRGSRKRPGLVIESKNVKCKTCNATIKHDRWTGEFRVAVTPASIPAKLQRAILKLYGSSDSFEQRKRPATELVIDHRFPMNRWGGPEERNSPDMTADEIRRKFQLLKKDASGNHNLLKSRACEFCRATGSRGTPMGIRFWYEGGERWPQGVPEVGAKAESGCVGCGWYDVAKWRTELNARLAIATG